MLGGKCRDIPQTFYHGSAVEIDEDQGIRFERLSLRHNGSLLGYQLIPFSCS